MEHINRYITKDIIDNNLIVIHNLVVNEDYNDIINQILNIIKNKYEYLIPIKNKNARSKILEDELTNITEIRYIIKLCSTNGYNHDDENVDIFGEKYKEGLIKILKVGSKELLKYFITIEGQTLDTLSCNMPKILINNYNKIVKYIIDHGLSTSYECIMANAAYNNNKKMVKYMISKKSFNLNYCIYSASENNNINLIGYLISCGAVDFDDPMYSATRNNYAVVVEYMIAKGATDFDSAIDIATYYKYTELARYLQQQLLK